MGRRVATWIRKGIKSSSEHIQPQPDAPLKPIKPGRGSSLKGRIQAQHSAAVRAKQSQTTLAPDSWDCLPEEWLKSSATWTFWRSRGPSLFCFPFLFRTQSVWPGSFRHKGFMAPDPLHRDYGPLTLQGTVAWAWIILWAAVLFGLSLPFLDCFMLYSQRRTSVTRKAPTLTLWEHPGGTYYDWACSCGALWMVVA